MRICLFPAGGRLANAQCQTVFIPGMISISGEASYVADFVFTRRSKIHPHGALIRRV